MTSIHRLTSRPSVESRIAALEDRLDVALAEVHRLTAVEAIRQAVLRFGRGLDRLDRELMASVFLPDATVDYGEIFRGPVAEFLDATITNQAMHTHVQHLTGNVGVQVHGERAVAESYELAHHTSQVGTGTLDLILAMRNLDEFERCDGEWRIRRRVKLSDWSRSLGPADPPMGGRSPLARATRDTTDLSYRLFDAEEI